MQRPLRNKELIVADLILIDGKLQKDIALLIDCKRGVIERVFKGTDELQFALQKYAAIVNLQRGRAILPGLINCHSHAFQRGLRGFGEMYPNEGGSFWTWRQSMYEMVSSLTPEKMFDLCYDTFLEMRRSGITAVGEFHYLHHIDANKKDFGLDEIVLKAAKQAGIRIVLLNAFYKKGNFGQPLNEAQSRFNTESTASYLNLIDNLNKHVETSNLQTIGVVAHSIRAVPIEDIATLYQAALERGMVMHIHMEEQVKEVADCKLFYGDEKTPTQLILDKCATDLSNLTLVHCTQTKKEELTKLMARGAHICLCPITEGNLGDGIPDLQSMTIDRVVIGTDSNIRIDCWEELRWLELVHRLQTQSRGRLSQIVSAQKQLQPSTVSPVSQILFEMATVHGAQSLALKAGVIAEGFLADFVAIDLSSTQLKGWTQDTLLSSLIFGSDCFATVSGNCVGGRWIEYNRQTLSDGGNTLTSSVAMVGSEMKETELASDEEKSSETGRVKSQKLYSQHLYSQQPPPNQSLSQPLMQKPMAGQPSSQVIEMGDHMNVHAVDQDDPRNCVVL